MEYDEKAVNDMLSEVCSDTYYMFDIVKTTPESEYSEYDVSMMMNVMMNSQPEAGEVYYVCNR